MNYPVHLMYFRNQSDIHRQTSEIDVIYLDKTRKLPIFSRLSRDVGKLVIYLKVGLKSQSYTWIQKQSLICIV